MAVEWTQARDGLLAVVERLKQRKAVDIGIRELLNAIPVVGGFVGAYWDQIETPGESDALDIATFLEQMADNRALFERAERRLEAIGDSVLQLNEPLAQVLGDLQDIRDDTSHIREVVHRLEAAVQAEPARRGLAFGLAMLDDRERAERTLAEVNQALLRSGQTPSPAGYYMLGMAAAGRYDYARAEASLLEAVSDPALAGVAHRGLAITYQRWAHEQITDENYGFAEDLLEKSATHGKEAATRDLLDPVTLNQLGYTSKDLAIRFQRTNRPAQAEHHFDEALRYFTNVLKMNADDASAHNGVASVSLMRGDHDRAISEAEAAIALHPDYREAQFDLAQAYYVKVRAHPDDMHLLLRALDVMRTLMQREQDSPQLPQHALQQLMALYEPLITRANALASQSAAPAMTTEPAPPPSGSRVGIFALAGAVTAPHVDGLSAALEAYVEYLHALGHSPDEPRPAIFIDPDESPEHARVAYADRRGRRLVVGLALVEQRDAVLHEYTHYALEGAASAGRESWPAGVRALEAGLAYYLPCSHGDDPRHVGLYDLRVARRPPPPWLDQAHRDGLAWATALWQLRTDVGAEVLDRLLLETWRASAILPTGPSEETFVERLDHALLDNHPSRTLNDLLREHGAMLESG
jgi:tetratricopeptide (TPR) repeat protein